MLDGYSTEGLWALKNTLKRLLHHRRAGLPGNLPVLGVLGSNAHYKSPTGEENGCHVPNLFDHKILHSTLKLNSRLVFLKKKKKAERLSYSPYFLLFTVPDTVLFFKGEKTVVHQKWYLPTDFLYQGSTKPFNSNFSAQENILVTVNSPVKPWDGANVWFMSSDGATWRHPKFQSLL